MSLLTDKEREEWAGQVPDAPFHRTDAGNGEHFARLYGDRIRYDHRRGRWLVWNGNWWRDDDRGEVRRLAKEAARDRYLSGAGIADLDERRAEARFAIASENRNRLEAMLTAARSESPIADAGDRWDADPLLMGVANGVVDLRTGGLRPGVPGDRITLHNDVAFDRDARCPRWERFLDEILEGDASLIDYVRRAVGYSLTGDTSAQCVFTCWGAGSNGKSVFLATVRAIAGGYATNTPFATFEQMSRSGIPNDLAALAGRRIVTASEVNEGTRLNEARLKALTGGDPITARFLHGEFFTFQPVLKLWLAVNHKPVVKDDSHGFWRRVRLIPFTRRFSSDADPGLIHQLRAESPGILAWAVQGAIDWQRDGLEAPDPVTAATEIYRAESDPLGDFLDDCTVSAPGVEAAAGSLYSAYRSWAAEASLREREVLTSTAFGGRLSGRYQKVKRKRGWVYLGVGLRGEQRASVPGR